MIKVVNTKGLRQAVWDFLIMPSHDRPMLIYCQKGCKTYDSVIDVVWTYARSQDETDVEYNKDETIDICEFVTTKQKISQNFHKFIIVTVLPYDDSDALMERFSTEFECLRHRIGAEEFVSDVRWSIQAPIKDFLTRNPQYVTLRYDERPLTDSLVPCPDVYDQISTLWARTYLQYLADGKKMRRFRLVRTLMKQFESQLGSYRGLCRKMRRFLLFRNLDDMHMEVKPFFDRCN